MSRICRNLTSYFSKNNQISKKFGMMFMIAVKERYTLKLKKMIHIIIVTLFVTMSIATSTPVNAESVKTIEAESIYDLLVDRFFNGSGLNDDDVNTKNPNAFNGGDFQGLISKQAFIEQMGFSIVSIGAVFQTEKYDGSMPTSYTKLEPHFGTEEELQNVISTYEKSGMKIMVDFPLSNVSENHEWFANGGNRDWISSEQNGKIALNLENANVQTALKDSLKEFIEKYNVSIRLTNIEEADTTFLNDLIKIVKDHREHAYVISNQASDANFDASYDDAMIEKQRNIFKTVDQDSSNIVNHIATMPPTQVLIDSPWTDRFILYGEQEGMYPPTRAKMAVLSTLLLPGVPVVQYGTEIAMNGTAGSEAHQLYNFKTDSELIDQISNVQQLRNTSETLRNGKFDLLKNENGYIAFTRISDEEQWLVVINNTSRTKNVVLSKEQIGEGKKVVALLEPENIREDKNGNYTVILDREMVEIYHIQEDKGINKAYIIALGLVYVLFTWFVIVIVRRGKIRRAEQDAKK